MRIIIFISGLLMLAACNRNVPYQREELKKRTFHYFWDLADKNNYQIPDRYPTLTFSSIAATGFGLSSYIVGVENGYVLRQLAADRVLKTLQTLWNLPQGKEATGISGFKGFYYHFLNLNDATRYKQVELSSIDTGLLMAGILSVQSYFDKENPTEKEIRKIADQLYLRVDWNWMMNGNKSMSMGWHPESGFIRSEWKGYNEAMVLLIMALGSPTHPIPDQAWESWCETYEWSEFMGQQHIQFDPLFGHQYSHIWIDFRGIQDKFMQAKNLDYFENSRKATLGNKAYCLSNPGNFKGYNENCWGLTACDGPYNGELQIEGKKYTFFDYRARGASSSLVVDDGTIAPTAAGGSMAFAPVECEAALTYMWNQYYSELVGPFGFKDAFNLTFKNDKHPNGWFDIDYLGIDQGPILLQMANLENEVIWKTMKKNKYIVSGLQKAGFNGGWLETINKKRNKITYSMKRILYTILLIPFFAASLSAQWMVSGKVTDAKDGTPLIGATIEEAGTLTGTVTDFDGSYTLNVNSGNAKLIIKYVGYAMQEIEIANRNVIDVLMGEDGVMLEQVVVVGYGVQRKSDVTGSISSVKGKEIEKIATSNIEQALQGKVAGLHVTPASGNPGAGAVIRIRGTGTLNNANPLYVIDGMITYDASLVNPQDVESIEILKDASAAAIYGSRGANGVIIITTKNGRQKKGGQISLSTYYGTQTITREIAMLNGQQFATAYNALRGQNYYPDPSIFGEGTNYQKEIFREAPIYNVQVAASGGNEQTTYNFSANYFDQDGILKNTSFKRGTFRLNTDTKLNPWLTFGNNLSFLISKSQNGPNVVSSAYRMPSVLSPYTEDGAFTDPTFFGLALANPLADQFYKSNNFSNGERLFGNTYLEAQPIKGLRLRSNFGYDRSRDKSKFFEPEFAVSASQRNGSDRLSVGQSAGNNWIWEQTVTYSFDLGKDHSLTVLGGYTAEERSSEWIGGSREHFPGTVDELLYLSSGNDTTQMNYGGAVDEALVSQLFRVNYSLKDKYFLTGSVRRDQSSRFTEENRTGYFPSASLGWNLGRESFIEGLNIFTDLKMRMSYGILGNQASASTYPSAGVVSSGLYGVFGSTESLSQGATLLTLSNPNLHWETSSQADIGIDASFFEGKLTIEADWYRRLTYDIISSVPIPSYVGSQSNPVVNTAEVLNRGFDLSVKYNKAGTFSYSLGANLSPVHNEVTKLAQGKNEIFSAFLQGEPATHTEVGLPIGAFYGYQVEGIFQNAEEIASSATIGGEKPGDIKFKDIDANGVIDEDDRVYLGSPIPTLTYGFSFNCDYKGFDFSADLLGVSGNKVYNSKETFRFAVYNWEQHVADAWTVDNPSTTEPRVTNGGHNYRVSDRFLQDGSFLRLRTLSLGYTLPQSICEKIKIGSLRVYVSGNNLYTRQKYTGYSPEFANSSNPFEVGFDNGSYPIAKSTQFGLDLKF